MKLVFRNLSEEMFSQKFIKDNLQMSPKAAALKIVIFEKKIRFRWKGLSVKLPSCNFHKSKVHSYCALVTIHQRFVIIDEETIIFIILLQNYFIKLNV